MALVLSLEEEETEEIKNMKLIVSKKERKIERHRETLFLVLS